MAIPGPVWLNVLISPRLWDTSFPFVPGMSPEEALGSRVQVGINRDIRSADDNLARQPTLGVQINFLLGFNKGNFEEETGNYKQFHLLIKGNKR